ncbi:MAG: hypothetical protein QOJ64_3465 [Acidobacteriota bacterium]|nr:hypothetical protein [Acidobacteriota bacterium]
MVVRFAPRSSTTSRSMMEQGRGRGSFPRFPVDVKIGASPVVSLLRIAPV